MSNKIYAKFVLTGIICLFLITLTTSCGKNYKAAKNMSQEHKDFISEVRYIINKKEKKLFYSLVTEEERSEFITTFWKQRDPDPSTDENEFKIDYYDRIEQANKLFRDGGKHGWKSDRGRVYILLGPPEHRRYNPGEINSSVSARYWYNYPHEVWYYGFYPILFIDRNENGTFQLLPSSGQVLSRILQTTLDLKPEGGGKKVPYDFDLRLKKMKDGTHNLLVKVPYRNILFQQEGDSFNAVLTVHVTIYDSRDKQVQQFEKDYTVTMTEKELQKADKDHQLEVPFTISKGKYQMEVVLESKADDIKTRRKIKFQV
jgi:GWxTD domain-containing protein